MRIGFVTQWYAPEGAAAAHPTVIAQALAARGHEVEVVTGFPNYPHGKIYDGYRMGLRAQHETLDNIHVTRVPLVPSHNASTIARAATYISYAISSLRALPRLSGCDVVLVYASPATAALVGAILRKLRGVPYVLYIQDLWPDSVLESGFIKSQATARLLESVIHRLCDALYRSSSSVLTIAPGMSQRIIGRGIKPERVEVVYNWIDEQAFRPGVSDPRVTALVPPGTQLSVMYAGSIGELQQLETAIFALAEVRVDQHVHLILVGDGVAKERVARLAAELGVEAQVSLLPPRSIAAMADTLASADVQLISLKDVPLLRFTIPSKVQACMSAGVPVVCAASGDAADLIGRAGCGITVRPGDHHALAAGWRQMAALTAKERRVMGYNGRRYYQRHFAQDKGTALLESRLLEAAGSRS